MQQIKRLIIGSKILTNIYDIKISLMKYGFSWLLDAEMDNVVLEIKDDKLFWLSGVFYYGTWKYGIVLNGDFRYCVWEDGIFYNGKFRGKFKSGIFVNGVFDGENINGDIRCK